MANNSTSSFEITPQDPTDNLSDKPSLNILPAEIISTILGKLEFHDRKIGRLVCRTWYNHFNRLIFRQKEKIVCRGFYGSKEINNVLCGLKFHPCNIEFQRFDISCSDQPLPSAIFQTIGHNIHRLSFLFSSLPDKLSAKIVEFCPNLRYLEIDALSECTLNSLIEQNVVRVNLVAIKTMFFGVPWIEKLFLIFPNIENLSLCASTTDFPPAQHLNSPKFIKRKFRMEFRENVGSFFDSAVNYSMLQDLRIEGLEDNHYRPAFLHFLLAQKQLRRIYLRWLFEPNEPSIPYAILLLRLLLSKFPNLVSLCLKLSFYGDKGPLVIDADTWNLLIKSKLECFRLVTNEIKFGKYLFKHRNGTPKKRNYSLKRLSIGSVCSSLLHSCIKSFPNLQHLHVNGCSIFEGLLAVISKHLPNLTILRCDSCIHARRYSTEHVDEQDCLPKIENLRCLNLGCLNNEEDWIYGAVMIVSSCLHSLEYLFICITGHDETHQNMLFNVISKLKNLKALVVTGLKYRVPFYTWLNLSKSLTNLVYLRLHIKLREVWPPSDRTSLDTPEIERIFHQSPSLKVINFTTSRDYSVPFSQESYFYDRTRKSIYRITGVALYSFTSEEIDNLNFRWITF